MIKRLQLLEKQLTSSQCSINMRHNSSHKKHCISKRVTNDLESTTEGLKRGLNFAHRLLGNHHVRTGQRHKATKGSLSLLKRQQVRARRQQVRARRQQVRARRQRLALKKQLRRAVAQQSLLERKMERLHHILDVILHVSTDCHVTHALRKLVCVCCISAVYSSLCLGHCLTRACKNAVVSFA